MTGRWIIALGFTALVLAAPTMTAVAQPSAVLAQKAPEADTLAAIAAQQGYVRIIVQFEPPVAASQVRPDAARIATIKSRVAEVQNAIIVTHFGSTTNPISGPGFDRGITRFEITPGFAVNVTAAEMEALAADQRVKYINHDRADPPTLIQSVPLIGMTNAYAGGATGAGWAVAVLDTGVKSNHEFLSGKVVAEACFSLANGGGAAADRVTLCPNGTPNQTGTGAANSETSQCINASTNLCDHGTHVSGIAAGFNTNLQAGEPPNGVAKNANIFAIQVFTRFNGASDCSPGPAPCILTFNSDTVRALDYVFANLTLPDASRVASVNMSLGGGLFSSTCDSDSRKPSIDNLRAAGVLTAIASGNNGSTTQISSPGCVSTAVTVGSTTKADVISSFSNSSAVVDLLAPGSSILSSIPVVPSSTTAYAFFSGTSMATPHVAGAIAALRTTCPTATADAIENALKNTGLAVTDNRAGAPTPNIVKPRIQVDLALQQLGCGAGGPNILAAVLPNARTTTVGVAVTGFGTILNPGNVAATQCSVALPNSVPATLHYQLTNAQNTPIGSQDTPFDIAAGASQTLFFSITPTAIFTQDIALVFDCTNTSPASVTFGVNTFLVTVGNSAIMDMLSIADTLTHDGITHIPTTAGTGLMVTAAINIGAAGTAICAPTPTPVGQPPRTLAATLTVCQTDAQGVCINPVMPGSSSTVTVANNETVFFAIFAQGQGSVINFDPANKRIFFICTQGTTAVGDASVAACTGTVNPGAQNCN